MPAPLTSPSPSPAVADGVARAHAAEQNLLLRHLPLGEYALLHPLLEPEPLEMRRVLCEPDDRLDALRFPRVGVLSVLATRQEGGIVEVGTIGREGFLGLPHILGSDVMPMRVICQVDGDAWRLPVDAFQRLVEERPTLRHAVLRYAQYQSEDFAQSVACNRLHSLEARCARWLLATHDRVTGDEFALTHEFMSMMLGVRRAGVTVVLGALQGAGIVRSTRGRVQVLDRLRLEQVSCGCHRLTREARERLLGPGPAPLG